jgi:hypothetical protein
MAHFKAVLLAALGCLALGAGSAFPANPLNLQSKLWILILKDRRLVADNGEFASKEEAQAFLTKALPLATADNPKYRSGEGALTQWLTREIAFGPGKTAKGVSVAMKEDILEFRNGAQSATGTHEVQFAIEDVQISELTDSKDLTENGDKAVGVIFRCISGKCIAGKWSGAPTPADWSDISIQDSSLRAKILAAFQMLKRAADEPQ